MSRVVEYRETGWSDRASVCLAIESTGKIITSAGVIMSISFAGLLIPRTVVLNQYGFSLFVGVFLDTFLVRTFIVPAIITAAGNLSFRGRDLNWWPRLMPVPVLSPEDEDKALWEGCWSPRQYSGWKKTGNDGTLNNGGGTAIIMKSQEEAL